MFHIKTMTPEDFKFATQITDKMHWGLTAADFEFMIELEPEGCFILLEDEEKIGFAETVSYGPIAWFGNLIINENQRNKGAGSQLVEHSIEYLKRKHAKTIGLYAYTNRIHFYERLGFKQDKEFLVLTGKSTVSSTKPKFSHAYKENLKQIIEFDQKCFGTSRRKLLEPIILDHDNLCETIIDEGHVAGYVVAKVFRNMGEIGPLIHREHDEQAATNLLKAVLATMETREISVCLASGEDAVLSFLKTLGFTENFRVERMFLGSPLRQDCVCMAESLERG